ncbi:MAG: SLBB domain-containing protein [Candidatus Dojkabacteria bacterium]
MRNKFLLTLFFCLTLFCISAYAQNVSLENIKNFKADELNDEQVLQIYQKMQTSGVSEESAYQLMQQKGLPSSEVEKLKKRIAMVKSGVKSNNNSNLKPKPDSISYSRQTPKIDPEVFNNTPSEIYGQSFFSNPKLSFEPNVRLATPQGYIVGPDDELVVILSGLNETSVKSKVTPEGMVQIPYVGLVLVNGLSIEQARLVIKSRMSKIYPALNSGETKLSVTLGNIRSLRVTIIGEVKQPGTYTISSLSSVFNALYQSGGPKANGSLRNIELIRNNKVVKTIDFYDFLQNGFLKGNIRLEDQDVIRIPFYKKRVVISGEVKSPALFELKEAETLLDLVNLAGGFGDDAYQQMVKVFQKGKAELMVKDVPESFFENYVPQNADSVVIGKILTRYTNRVSISGAVYRPGVFELSEGLNLMQLIKNASGLRGDALLQRGYINRIAPDLTKQTVSFDLANIISGKQNDIILQREDEVVILSSNALKDEMTVSISGLVKNSGTYIYREGMQLQDLVAMAGGFDYNAATHRIEISRIIPDRSDSVSNQLVKTFIVSLDSNFQAKGKEIFLQPLDKITIPQLVNYQVLGNINIGGEVLFPGKYALQRRDETALELIARAGGLTPSASLANTQIYRSGLRVDADLTGKDRDKTIILLPQDSVYIPKENPFVEVVGGVNTPQLFRFQSRNFKYYINASGGTRQNVKLKNAYVSYPNGINSPVKSFLFFKNYPMVTKGSKIVVPEPGLDVKVKLGVGEISAAATILTALVSLIAILSK